ncbi:hypothetical protein CSB37_03920 [bacterium DOLZORAL124_38_8]|nr:MAG: hypothetical protein CSB37_03920 [bacterium DOLZORAL124_38_8]
MFFIQKEYAQKTYSFLYILSILLFRKTHITRNRNKKMKQKYTQELLYYPVKNNFCEQKK